MKNLFTLFLTLVSFVSIAQVGIGNTNPKSTLDISASNQSAPTAQDGILIPRIDAFPATDPIVDQDSMLVYLTTTDGTNVPGFYYWNNASTSWLPFGSSKDAWELLGNVGTDDTVNFIGTTDTEELVFRTNNIENARLTNKGQFELGSTRNNMFIGKLAGENFDVSGSTFGRRNIYVGEEAGFSNVVRSDNIALGYRASYANTLGSNSVAIGNRSLEDAIDTDYSVAIGSSAIANRINSIYNVGIGHRTLSLQTTGNRNTAIGADAGRTTAGDDSIFVGYSADQENDGGNNVVIGTRAGIQGFTSYEPTGRILIGNKAWQDQDGDNVLAIENSSSVTPLVYGEFDSNILRVGGQLQIGSSDDTTAGLVYAFPTTDGTSGQVLTTDGSGVVTWQNGSTVTNDADWFEQGTTDAPNAITDNIFTQGNVGIGDTTPDNILDIEATAGDALVTITADPANTNEDANPRLVLSQDGGAIQGVLELGNDNSNDSNDFIFSTINNGSDFVFEPNSTEKLRLTTKGQLEIINTGKSTFIGNNTGNALPVATNQWSVFIGDNAGQSHTGGNFNNFNTAVGSESMDSATGGGFNTAVGARTLQRTTTGSYNSVLGQLAGESITTGFNNTALGQRSLYLNTTGSDNTAVGQDALAILNGGNGNVGLGQAALSQLSNGSNNVAIGFEAGNSTNGVNNSSNSVYLGTNAGYDVKLSNALFINSSNLQTAPDTETPLIGGDFTAKRVGINVDISPLTNLTHTLTVNGDVRASGGFSTPTNTYPDYVFEDYFTGNSTLNSNYKFTTLNNAIQFVKENGHLPNVKSYQDIKDDGMAIDLGETSVKNLEKIEENFIYISELKNEIDVLKAQNKMLKEKLELILSKLSK